VIKTNNRGKKQDRILGIDGHFIYNDVGKKKRDSKFSRLKEKMFSSSDVKRAQRPLSSIHKLSRKSALELELTFEEKKGYFKALNYEFDDESTCSEVIAKLKYLRELAL